MKRVAWFKDITKDDISIAGGKGANLGEMTKQGFPVPPGFVVTAQTYKEFIERTDIKDKINNILSGLDIENTKELQERANKIQKLIVETKMPDDIKEEITEAYENMELMGTESSDTNDLIEAVKEPPFVAVRSSATAEDLPEASFAGQQATFLNVKGSKELIRSVSLCWASLFTARAIYYREKNNFEHDKVLISDIVQKMVNSEKAGVMFSVNPATNNKEEIVIEAAYGLGETVVSGSVNPDMYIVDKETLEIKDIEIKGQEFGLFRNTKTGKNFKKTLDYEEKKKQKLNEDEIIFLAKLAKDVEKHYGKAQDMEWAVEGDNIYIVQARAVTTLKEKRETEQKIEGNILVKGMTASPGIGVGPVKFIKDATELDRIIKGDVLVTVMTNPDMVPAMKKAAAIITDEGGITCIEGNAKIFTNNGFIKLKDVGELLSKGNVLFTLSLDTESKKTVWRKILISSKRKSKSIEFSPYLHPTGKMEDSIKITSDHKMISLEGDCLKVEPLESMIKCNKKLLVADKIPKLEKEYDLSLFDKSKLMYLCGSIFSDGHIVKRKSGKPMRVMFSQKITNEKMNYIDTVTTYFSDLFGGELRNYTSPKAVITHEKGQWARAASFECSRAEPARTLQTMQDNFVRIISSIDGEYIVDFLAGLIDGDGHFNKEKQYIEIYVNINDTYLLESITIACLRLGIVPKIRRREENAFTIILNAKFNAILGKCKRVHGIQNKKEDEKLFSSRQLLIPLGISDWRGSLYNYLKNDSFVGINWLADYLKGHCDDYLLEKIKSLQNSDFRMTRFKPIRKTEEIDVYNITVSAYKEEDHNYIVFTKNYLPIIVGNCHAAIVSREMGIPCIVGTENATSVLKEDSIVTVYATKGEVYEGKVAEPESAVDYRQMKDIKTKTNVDVILGMADFAEKAALTGADGVGLLRLEFIIANGKVHPAEYIRQNRDDEYTDMLVREIEKIADAFKGKQVWIRTSDVRTDEYRNLEGGEKEPKESDPMIGWHGIRRSLDEQRILKAEFKAIKKLHDAGYTTCGVMLPFVIRADEVRQAKEIMRSIGLEPCKDVEFGVMIETPAACWVIEEICKEGIDFVSFGTNDLTQLTLGIDRNNERIQKLFDEMHPAVLGEIEKVMKTCQQYNVKTSICGQAGSRPEMAEFLVRHNVHSISANPDAVHRIKEVVAEVEKKLGV